MTLVGYGACAPIIIIIIIIMINNSNVNVVVVYIPTEIVRCWLSYLVWNVWYLL